MNAIFHWMHDNQWADTVGAAYYGEDEETGLYVPSVAPRLMPRYWLSSEAERRVWDLWDEGHGWLYGSILQSRDHDLWPWAYDPDADRMVWVRTWTHESLPAMPTSVY